MSVALTVGSLFAGIGGLELGLERAGMEVKWQVEIDDYCRRVLAKHWPDVPRYGDIHEVGAHNLEPVDLICGGFPCQDISHAGRRAGIEGQSSGLWAEFARIVGDLRPRYVIVENVSAVLVRGLGTILGDLAGMGYDAEWGCVPAAAVGAPHLRARIFILAYPCGVRDGPQADTVRARRPVVVNGHRWPTIPRVCRADDGVPTRVDRLKSLGNAVVPQVAEWIGRLILES